MGWELNRQLSEPAGGFWSIALVEVVAKGAGGSSQREVCDDVVFCRGHLELSAGEYFSDKAVAESKDDGRASPARGGHFK